MEVREAITQMIEADMYEVIGVRYSETSPEECSHSYEWEDGEPTDEELTGLSAIEVVDNYGEINKSWGKLIDCYSHLGDLYVVAGGLIEAGNDEGEIVVDVEKWVKCA